MRAFVAATMQKVRPARKGLPAWRQHGKPPRRPDRARPGASGAAPPRRFCQGGLAACPILAPATIAPRFGPPPPPLRPPTRAPAPPGRGRPGRPPPPRFCQGGPAACPFPPPATIAPSFGPRPAALGARTLVRARCIPAIGCLGPAQRVVARERAPP